VLDLPQQENSNRENPMKSFKIEYVDGVLTVLETDGQSRMNEACMASILSMSRAAAHC
jgi:hypothetical protein